MNVWVSHSWSSFPFVDLLCPNFMWWFLFYLILLLPLKSLFYSKKRWKRSESRWERGREDLGGIKGGKCYSGYIVWGNNIFLIKYGGKTRNKTNTLPTYTTTCYIPKRLLHRYVFVVAQFSIIKKCNQLSVDMSIHW